ncbi:MAG: ABC transporter permease [Bacillota bacterium]|jgi:peptide/nickel transport system permease protein|nr:ABC transporter permease [Bacillota bacterium]
MLPYIVKRVLGMIPSLIIISFITFFVIQLPPGDFVTSVQSQVASSGGGMDAATVEALRVRYGLDQPQVVQYWRWIKGFPTGDFGYSLEWSAPVWDVIATRMGWTLLLSGLALVFMWVVSIPIGVYSATHQYSIGDNIFSFLGFLGLSIPDFLLSLIWLVVGTLVLGIPAYGLFSPEMADAPWSLAKFLDLLKHLWAPVIIMGIIGTAELIRIMRGSLLDVLNQQYVTTARAKGLHEKKVIKKYAVRMAINPLISVLGMQIPKMISSSIIVGLVLSIPTVGPIFLRSLISQDMYLAGVILLFMAVMLLVSNLLADLVLAWIDPRIRYE